MNPSPPKSKTPKSESNPQEGQYSRPASIEEWTNRAIIHPISQIFAKLAIMAGISANIVSFAGLFSGLAAAYFYYQQSQIGNIFAGFGFMVLWHIFDGADGRVARATGTSSAFGRIIDGICDHLVFGAVYIAILLYAQANGAPASVWILGIGAGLCHAVQAAGYEERRQKFQRRSRGLDRADVSENLLAVDGKTSRLASLYDAAQRLVSPGGSALDPLLQARRETAPDTVQGLVNKTAIIVRGWSLLNANNRTIMIFIFCALGHPLWYFIYEITALNLIMFLMIGYERREENRIVKAAQNRDLT